jgi:hypothetical protein
LDRTPDFLEFVIEAERSLLALNTLNSESDLLEIHDALNHAARVYAELRAVQEVEKLSPSESASLQSALDRLRGKLHFFEIFL